MTALTGEVPRKGRLDVLKLAATLLAVPGAVVLLGYVQSKPDLLVPSYIALILGVGAFCYRRLPHTSFRLFCLYVLAFGLFNGLRTYADDTGYPASYSYPITLDSALFGTVPTAWLQDRFFDLQQVGWIDWMALVVYLSYFIGHFVLAGALWAFRRDLLVQHTGAITATLFLGLAVYFLLPTAPPWLAAHAGDLSDVVRITPMVTNEVSRNAYDQGSYIAGTNDVAAMPSLHTALTAVVAMSLWRVHRLAGVAGWAYVGAMAFSLMYLGEHYLIDLIAGVATAIAGWKLVAHMALRRAGMEDEVEMTSVADLPPVRAA
jgi:membrane-associated phospholipid phosphatase